MRGYFHNEIYVHFFTGQAIHLGFLSKQDTTVTSKDDMGDHQVKFRTCGTVQESNCAAKNGSACFYDENRATAIAKWTDDLALEFDNTKKLPYLELESASSEVKDKFRLFFSCSTGADSIALEVNQISFSVSVYEVTVTSPKSCFGLSGDDGLSGGWIFIIILLSVLFVYVVAGMIYAVKFQHKNLSPKSLPGASIWVAIFTYAIAGVGFTVNTIKSKCGKKSMDTSGNSYGTAEEY